MAEQKEVRLIITFSGFKPDVDYSILRNREEVCKEAESWVTTVPSTCMYTFGRSKRQAFDMMSDALVGEAQQWFQRAFTPFQRFKQKNLKDFVQKFRDTYCVVPVEEPTEETSINKLPMEALLALMEKMTGAIQVLRDHMDQFESCVCQHQPTGKVFLYIN